MTHFNTKHGMKKTRFYRIWSGMKSRCINKKHNFYYLYGGRGITVCDKWLKFIPFYNDMYKSYVEKQKDCPTPTIDRVDNSKGYYKANCRWASQKEQLNNTRINVNIEYNGVKKHITEWAEELDIKRNTLYSRIFLYGWTITEAFTKQKRRRV